MPAAPTLPAELLGRLPTVLAVPLHEFARAADPEPRLHRLCDAAEFITRFCTVLAVAEARLPQAPRPLPEPLVRSLGPTIQTPTFARWLGMAGDLADFLARERGAPTVLPGLPRFIREVLLKTAPAGSRFLDGSLLELRNLLAHGGALSAALAEYLLSGDPSGLVGGAPPSISQAEEGFEEVTPDPPPTAFPGWAAVLGGVVRALADLLEGSRVCTFDGEAVRPRTGLSPFENREPLSADLRLALRQLRLEGHVLLLRDGRWLDLWPLCDHGKARLTSLRRPLESAGDAPLLYYRGEPRRLLYAALGATPPVGERPDAVADFEALFRPGRPREVGDETAPDFTEELRRDAQQLVGRTAELRHVKDVLRQTTSGVLWLSGAGGIGKSFLAARVAVNQGNDPRRWCCVPWRFRVSDTDRSNPSAFLRHAITALARWPALGRAEVRPDLDSDKLPAQLDELLRAAGQLQPAGKDGKSPRVLFVLDGMDEAARLHPDLLEWPFRFVHPNVVWLCAGRSEATTQRAFAPDRCTRLFPAGLPPIGAGDVRELLYQELGEQRYRLLAEDARDAAGNMTNPLVAAIVERSEGLPLYVHFLVEDLLTGEFALDRSLIERLPRGLAAYYDDLLGRIGVGAVQALLTPLVASVVWGRGPVAEEVLLELMFRRKVLRRREEGQARGRLRQGVQAVGAMVRSAPLPEGGFGYEPYHLTFREHFRRDEAGRVADQNDLAREEFCDLTLDWAALPPRGPSRLYVLRHGPAHLLEEGRWEALYALARDEAFLRAQAEELPAEPEAPLRTLQAALTAAARHDDAAGMAEFLLRHAGQTQALQDESPFDALRRGNLGRALRLADLADSVQGVLYRLLLAEELLDQGRASEARQVLDQLAQRKLPRLSWEFGPAAAMSLARIRGRLPASAAELARRLLGDRELVLLYETLSAQGLPAATGSLTGDIVEGQESSGAAEAEAGEAQAARRTFAEARRKARTIEPAYSRCAALRDIAVAQAEGGQAEAARLTFAEARRTAGVIREAYSRSRALRDIAAAQARAGQPEQALETVGAIEEGYFRSEALRDIGAAQAEAGHAEAAHLAFEQALHSAGTARDAHTLSAAFWTIAAAQARAGQVEAALRTAGAIELADYRSGALGDIAAAQARAGRAEAAGLTFAQALQAAGAAEDPAARSRALRGIAAAQARAGHAEAARLTFAKARQAAGVIERTNARSLALGDIAAAQARAGQVEAARQTAGAIGGANFRSQAWRAVAAAEARAGRLEAARQTAGAIEDALSRCEAFRDVAAALAPGDDQLQSAEDLLEEAIHAMGATASERQRANLLGSIACLGASIGVIGQAVATARFILVERERHLPAIVESLLRTNDRTAFKELLIPCAAHLESAWAVCGLLAAAYPEQATAIAQMALQFGRPTG